MRSGWHVGHVGERVGVGELAALIGDGVSHLVAAEPDVRAPHSADRVDVLVAVRVEQERADTVSKAISEVSPDHIRGQTRDVIGGHVRAGMLPAGGAHNDEACGVGVAGQFDA